jgi:hypothetical protein
VTGAASQFSEFGIYYIKYNGLSDLASSFGQIAAPEWSCPDAACALPIRTV